MFDQAYVNAGRPVPPLFLIGHSFGCRVLASLVKQPSSFRDHVRGVVLLQPAMNELHVPTARDIDAPVVITFSRHDHANRVMYPLGTIPFNSGASDVADAFETIIEDGDELGRRAPALETFPHLDRVLDRRRRRVTVPAIQCGTRRCNPLLGHENGRSPPKRIGRRTPCGSGMRKREKTDSCNQYLTHVRTPFVYVRPGGSVPKTCIR